MQDEKQETLRKKESRSLWVRCFVSALVTVVVCVGFLFLTALIPQKAIQKNCEKSAEFYVTHALFEAKQGYESDHMTDNYADCILQNIIYQIDTQHPVHSSLQASYYQPEEENVDTAFYQAVFEGRISNVNYYRYWHGSMVILRPLFVLTDIQGVRMILGACVALMGILIIGLLCREKQVGLAVVYTIAMLVIDIQMLFRCIEYVMPFLVMQAVLIYVCVTCHNRCRKFPEDAEAVIGSYHPMFLAAGIVTSFVDFLTTETITFTVPMLFLLALCKPTRISDNRVISREDLKSKHKKWSGLMTVVKAGCFWLIGYAGMFLAKWVICALCFGREALMESLQQAAVRVGGQVGASNNTNLSEAANGMERLYGAVWHNLASLFSMRGTLVSGKAMVFAFGSLAVLAAFIYLFHIKKINWNRYVPWFLLALLPYIRYLALSNHAYLHFFFTYRAQLITVMVVLLFTWENVKDGLTGLVHRKRPKR